MNNINTAATQQQNAPLSPAPVEERNITDAVLKKITAFQTSGEIHLPKDYSAENALKSAWLVLHEVKNRDGKLALEVCTKESIANALLKMVVWGLSPLKKQCDFIVYGSQLTCSPEYTGNIVLAKRYGKLKNHNNGRAIFKGDVFEYETSTEPPYLKKLIKHKQELENLDNEVIGAYWCYQLEDGTENMEIMTIGQIKKAWGQGAAKGNSGAHLNFTDQMAIKTVINRGTKPLIRMSDDAVLFGEEEEEKPDQVAANVANKIDEKANKQPLSFTQYEEIKTTPAPEPKVDPKQNTSPDAGTQPSEPPF